MTAGAIPLQPQPGASIHLGPSAAPGERAGPSGRTGHEQTPARPEMASTLLLILSSAVFLCTFHLWRVGQINLTFSDVLFSTTFVIFAAAGRLQSQPFALLTPLWLLCLVTMLGGLFVSSLANGDMLRWAVIAGQYLFSFLALPMLLLGLPQHILRRLMLMLIAGVTAVEAAGVAGYYLVGGYSAATALFGPDFLTGGKRLGSFVGDANWNGAVIAMTLPFVIYAVRVHVLGPATGMVVGMLLVWGLLLSASFTAFSATAIAVTVSMVVGRSLPSARVVAGLTTIALSLAVAGYQPPDIFAKRVAPALETGSFDDAGTYTDRMELIQEAWLKAEDTMVIGLGADQYREFSSHHQPVHNMYMLLWVEGGFITMVAWIFMMMILLIVPLSTLRWHRLESALSLSVMTVFLINTMASPHMYHRLWIVPVLLAIGIALRANTPVILHSDYPLCPDDQPESRALPGA